MMKINKTQKTYAMIGGSVILAGLVGWKVMVDKRKTKEAKIQQKQQNRPMGNSTASLLQAGRSAGLRFQQKFAPAFNIRGTFGSQTVNRPQGTQIRNNSSSFI